MRTSLPMRMPYQVIQALRYLTKTDTYLELCLGATVLTEPCSPAMNANDLPPKACITRYWSPTHSDDLPDPPKTRLGRL